MSVVKQIDLSILKYYPENIAAKNLLMDEFLKNQVFILQEVINYQSYHDLLNKDFDFGFYILNLLFLYDDILNNKFNDTKSAIENDYITQLKAIINVLNLQTVKHAIKNFQHWTLDNLNQVFQNAFYIRIRSQKRSSFIQYEEILEFFLKYPINSQEEINKLIVLLDKQNRLYSKFLDSSKYKKAMKEHFKSFIETWIKDESSQSEKKRYRLIDTLELVDCYLKLIHKDPDHLEKVEKIISHCKNQINIKNNSFFYISHAELFVNLINSHGLKVPSTKDLSLWFENMIVESLKEPGWTEVKFPLPSFIDEESQKMINKAKEEIKNNIRASIFYDPKHETSFWYKEHEKNDWIHLIDNRRGSYSHNAISPLELSQKIYWNFFFQFFPDEEIFKIYTDNLASMFHSVLNDLGVSKDEIIFALERFQEIVNQLIEERNQTEEKTYSWYMKKNSLLLAAIEDTIKTFIKHIEKNNFNLIKDLESSSFSFYIGRRITKDFNSGTEFIPSDYIANILSGKAKITLDYCLYAPYREGGIGIRNPISHGSYYSKKFLNWRTFIFINILFFQLIEELNMNYIKNKLNIN